MLVTSLSNSLKMVMIELVYCKITGKTRSLPKVINGCLYLQILFFVGTSVVSSVTVAPSQVHHFIPLEPWTCNKIKGRRRQMKIDGTNDGPSSKFEKKEQIKLVLDMSNDGPMFKEWILFISKSNLTSLSVLLMFEMMRSSV